MHTVFLIDSPIFNKSSQSHGAEALSVTGSLASLEKDL